MNTGYLNTANNGWMSLITILVVFCFNPTIGFVLSLMMAISTSNDYGENRNALLQFLVIAAVWISLINITKSISGDQGTYSRVFMNVPKAGFVGTILNAWGGSGKEPVFSLITWCLYWLTGGSVRMYYFLLSMAIYLPHFLATYKLFKHLKLPRGALICGVLVLTFFTQYFVMTLQIIRQMLASGFVIYALVYRAVEGRNNWTLLVSSVLIHTSAAFLAILSLVPWFYTWLSLRRILIVLGCFIPVIVFNGFVGNLFGGSSGVSAIDYGLAMYGKTGYTDGGSISYNILLMLFVPLAIISIKILGQISMEMKNQMSDEESDIDATLLPIVYTCLLLLIFVLSFSKSPLIQYRFFYYSYSYLPLMIPLLATRVSWSRLYWIGSSAFFIVRFFLTHNHSGWKYASISDIISSTIYFYWTGHFHWMYLL